MAKLEEVNGGSSKGSLSSLQQQFSSPDSRKNVDDVAAYLSQVQAQIGGISIEDKPTELSKKDVILRCYQDKYRTTIETLRIVASDYSFAQIVEKLRQAEFEQGNTVESALRIVDNVASNQGKKDSRKCFYCGKVGHIKPDCRKKKNDDKNKKSKKNNESKSEVAGLAWKASNVVAIGENDWCIDSGATSHMTFNRNIFVEYEDYYSSVGTAKIGVNLNVIGRGKVVCPINGIKTVLRKFFIFLSLVLICYPQEN